MFRKGIVQIFAIIFLIAVVQSTEGQDELTSLRNFLTGCGSLPLPLTLQSRKFGFRFFYLPPKTLQPSSTSTPDSILLLLHSSLPHLTQFVQVLDISREGFNILQNISRPGFPQLSLQKLTEFHRTVHLKSVGVFYVNIIFLESPASEKQQFFQLLSELPSRSIRVFKFGYFRIDRDLYIHLVPSKASEQLVRRIMNERSVKDNLRHFIKITTGRAIKGPEGPVFDLFCKQLSLRDAMGSVFVARKGPEHQIVPIHEGTYFKGLRLSEHFTDTTVVQEDRHLYHYTLAIIGQSLNASCVSCDTNLQNGDHPHCNAHSLITLNQYGLDFNVQMFGGNVLKGSFEEDGFFNPEQSLEYGFILRTYPEDFIRDVVFAPLGWHVFVCFAGGFVAFSVILGVAKSPSEKLHSGGIIISVEIAFRALMGQDVSYGKGNVRLNWLLMLWVTVCFLIGKPVLLIVVNLKSD
jgi:hypothetical protein